MDTLMGYVLIVLAGTLYPWGVVLAAFFSTDIFSTSDHRCDVKISVRIVHLFDCTIKKTATQNIRRFRLESEKFKSNWKHDITRYYNV